MKTRPSLQQFAGIVGCAVILLCGFRPASAFSLVSLGLTNHFTTLTGPITNPTNGHTYYLLAATDRSTAVENAAALGGHLATINDAAENAWVLSTFGSYADSMWIGLNDQQTENTFVWANGERNSYRNWERGEPNNGAGYYPNEDGVSMVNFRYAHPGTWYDSPEEQLKPGVVEVDSTLRSAATPKPTTARPNLPRPATGTSSDAQSALSVSSVNANCFTHSDFSSLNGLSLAGPATGVDNFVRLTPTTTDQLGALWRAQKVYCAGGFTTEFRFRMSAPGATHSFYEPGGDGLSFSFQNESAHSLGTEYGATNNSLGVSFNTFHNYGLEPNGNFVGVVKVISNITPWLVQQPLNTIKLNDGDDHTAQIQFDGTNLTVLVDGTLVIDRFPVPARLALDVDGYSWVGFGARTGVSWQNHEILSWTFCGTTPPGGNAGIDPAPTTTLITDGDKYVRAALQSDGRLRLSLAAVANTTYVVQASTNLVDWVDIRLATTDSNGRYEIVEDIDVTTPQRFYRIVPQ